MVERAPVELRDQGPDNTQLAEPVTLADRAAQLGLSDEYAAMVERVTTEEFRRVVARAALRYGALPSETDDIVQETALGLLENSGAARRRLSDRFLDRATRLHVIDAWRRATGSGTREPVLHLDPTTDYTTIEGNVTGEAMKKPDGTELFEPDFADVVTDAVASRLLVDELLWRLSRDEQELVRLHYFERLTFSQIAARTDTPIGTLKSRHFHMVRSLRALFEDGVYKDGGWLL
jgi:RNA polymerase sigma factor (sigma-70 family)